MFILIVILSFYCFNGDRDSWRFSLQANFDKLTHTKYLNY